MNLCAQANGIVNIYTAVTGFNCDSSDLYVEQTAGFNADDLVLIIQMQGAEINLNNNADFGTILHVGFAGNYCFNRLESIGTGQVRLRYHLTHPFDVNGKVQLIRVPEYGNVTANGLTCKPWDGKTGGVLVIDVSDTLFLQSEINVSGKGFRGGKHNDTNNAGDNETNYFYPFNPELSSQKGEGIAIIQNNHSFGMGKAANGGGGGNAHNAGGGGGGNAGAGGNGGLEYFNTPSQQPTPNTKGLAGLNVFTQLTDRIIMGGGGGAGHENDNQSVSGGNGGGIIFINAYTIVTNSNKIKSNGGDVLSPGTNRNDGQGGGGAGGTIVLYADQLAGDLAVEAKGGRGGDCLFYVNSQIIGPGGGGGGGKLMVNKSFPNLLPVLSGGINGLANQNKSNEAEPGRDGSLIIDPISWCFDIVPNTLDIYYSLCFGDSIIINGKVYSEEQSFQDTIQSAFGCDTIALIHIQFADFVPITETISFCPGSTVNLNGISYTNPGVVTGISGSQTGCDTIRTTYLEWSERPIIYQNIKICRGESIIIGGISYSEEAVVLDTIFSNDEGCDTIRVTSLIVDVAQPFLPADTVICYEDEILLNSPFSQTYWNGTGPFETYVAREPGLVVAHATSDEGCLWTDSILIKTCCSDRNVYVPNIFSPNQDGVNDEFCLYSIDACSDIVFQVYDRWGELIFESQNPQECWDGNFRDRSMENGVYIWVAWIYSDKSNSTEVLKGSVTLIR
ncbi:MAG: gliding motility-associated C-terminal domain-containing protein [Saprospiraceae bacterium]